MTDLDTLKVEYETLLKGIENLKALHHADPNGMCTNCSALANANIPHPCGTIKSLVVRK